MEVLKLSSATVCGATNMRSDPIIIHKETYLRIIV